MNYRDVYEMWINSSFVDRETKDELLAIDDENDIEDRFYKELEFGTGGLRGVIGAGTNRINIYTVGKATQGLAEFLTNSYVKDISVCIAYDSRNMSREFAEAAALNLCANNIKVYLFESLRPTPMLSFAVRELGAKAGIVITASHNPKIYNGYKVYGDDGGQITDNFAKEVLKCISQISDFNMIKSMDRVEAIKNKLLYLIGEDVDNKYYEQVKKLILRSELVKNHAKELSVVYTPIHGSGNIPVRRILNECGFENVHVVREQELPDGNFPTAPYPNPEEPAVFKIAIKLAEEIQSDLVFGTDPDCDRIGVVVKNNSGEYIVLTGNQLGILLTEYILTSKKEMHKMPQEGALVKTIVTTDMVKKIAAKYTCDVVEVLTGFKYIGEKIKEFEQNRTKEFIFGFEESFGYLAGTFVRDKDAVITSLLASEMALFYKRQGKTLYDALQELYKTYGYYCEDLVSITLDGREGQEKINTAMELLRHSMKYVVGDRKIIKKQDYKLGVEKDLIRIEENIINMPKSNVLKFTLEDGAWFVVRPSGTEPKIKIYFSVVGRNSDEAKAYMSTLKNEVMTILNFS